MCASYIGTLCSGRFGLGWAHDVFIVACHMFMHFSCICTILFFPLILLLIGTFLLLSLSLSRIVCVWHPRANPLSLETLFVLRHHPFLILLPPMLNFVMIKPIKTFRRTSPNVAFIRNATLSYRTSPILIYPLSFTVRLGISLWDPGQLSLLDHTGVLLQNARIWFFHTSFHHFCSRYTYSSHSGAYLRCATRSEGIAS